MKSLRVMAGLMLALAAMGSGFIAQSARADEDERRAALKQKFSEISKQRKAEAEALSKTHPVPPNIGYLTPEEMARWQEAQQVVKDKFKLLDRRWAEEDAANRHDWVDSLDPMKDRGWTLLEGNVDGRTAIFATRKQLIRNDDVVSAWFRVEMRSSDSEGSELWREDYDCKRLLGRQVSSDLYSKPNLEGPNPAYSRFVAQKDQSWVPQKPDSVGEGMMDWACKFAPLAAKGKE